MSPFDPATEFFLNGVFAPTQSELDEAPVQVIEGALPADLEGTYYRNGPNPRFPPIGSYTYPLDGDGMVHAVRFEDGRARYGNRYVRTPSIAAEERAGRALWGGVLTPTMPKPEDAPEMKGQYKDLPDINVVRHGGRLLALAEGARQFALTDRLATVGPCDFDGKFPQGFCAHPKIDPATGELVVFRYGFEEPFLSWGVVGVDGGVTRPETPIAIDGPYMIHDCAITPSWLVIFVCPAAFDFTSKEPLRWAPERGTRIALVPRDGSAVRWITTDAFWVWHFANAFEDAGAIVIDYPQWDTLPFGAEVQAKGSVVRARIDPVGETLQVSSLDDRMAEFPRIDDRAIGKPHRYFYAAIKRDTQHKGQWDTLRRYDTRTGENATFAPNARIGEPVFVPSNRNPDEEAGYVVTYRYESDATDLVVLRAGDIGGKPAAVLRMPQRVPCGLHGCWVASA
jgi:carotenoid cleavage dioxygenase-like enzyme